MLIVLEGVDSSGKATQTALLEEYLKNKGERTMHVTFPDYESPSSALVKQYLGGSFGTEADSVSPYAASTFYAVDRYASYKTKWGGFLKSGGLVVCDRYVTSNMIHQAAKLSDKKEKDAFLQWIFDLEYGKLSLPQPDLVFFLDMPPAYAQQLMRKRANKITGKAEKDIHERDAHHIEKAYEAALYVAKKYQWKIIPCVANGELRSIASIHADIVQITEGALHGISTPNTCRSEHL